MEEIYQNYARMVYRYLFSLCHNEDMAEELTQETFCQAIRCIDRYDESCKISTWLCSIAKRQFLVYLRKHPNQESLQELEEAAYVESAEEAYLSAARRRDWMQRLRDLPEPFQEILSLRLFGELSFRQIGEIMKKSENWARVNFYRGKERLKKEVEKDET